MKAEYLQHKDGTRFIPITQPDAVIDSEGKSLTTNMAKKVDKETGKGLSTNDYTDAEKTKLASIESGAQVNPTDYVKDTDARLSDARTPLAHTHAISEVTNLQSSLDALSEADSVISLYLQGCQSDIGSKTELKTETKTDLVSAINEVVDSIGDINTILDSL